MADLITLADYKLAMNVNTTEYDAQLGFLIPLVSDAIKEYCNQEFASGTYIEKNNGIVNYDGYYMFYVKNIPITTITSIALDFYGTGASVNIDVSLLDIRENEGYAIYARAIDQSVSLIRPEYRDSFYYTITYVGGPDAVPSNVKMACIYALSDNFTYNYSNQIPSGTTALQGEKKSLKVADYGFTQTTTLDKLSKVIMDNVDGVMFSPTVKSLLKHYVNVGQSGGF